MKMQSSKNCKFKLDCLRNGIFCSIRYWSYIEKNDKNLIKGGEIMLEQFVNKIKNAKTDEEIKKVLCEVFIGTQIDSRIRKEFDEYIEKNDI